MAEGKILIRTVVDAEGGVRVLAELAGETRKAANEIRRQEEETKRLLDRLEPARAATERYAREQSLLRQALDTGKISTERYGAAMKEPTSIEVELGKMARLLKTSVDRVPGEIEKLLLTVQKMQETLNAL